MSKEKRILSLLFINSYSKNIVNTFRKTIKSVVNSLFMCYTIYVERKCLYRISGYVDIAPPLKK